MKPTRTRKFTAILCSIIFCAFFTPVIHAQLVINEYSAANHSAFGTSTENTLDRGRHIVKTKFEDWVEIYNLAGYDVSLQGYTLSDNPSKPDKYVIPANITVPANGRIIFVCSGKNGFFGNFHHTNFKLNQSSGKDFLILASNGVIVDSVRVLPAKKNHSRGRLTDGGPQWGVFETATPNAVNTGGKLRYMLAPEFSRQAGFYTSATTVEFTTSETNGAIYYTTDGTDPATSPTAKLYTSPVNIVKTTAIRSCVRPLAGTDALASPVVTNTYFINEQHVLPVISLCSGEFGSLFQFMKPKFEIAGSLEYFDKNKIRQVSVEGGIKGHGNDSWYYEQKGMRFYVRDEYGDASKIDFPLFSNSGRTKYDCIILRAAGSDNYVGFAGSMASTHIRDGFAQTLAEKGGLNVDTRKYQAVVVYLNGQYWGVYEMRERVDGHFTKEYYHQGKKDVDMLSYYGGISVENEAENSNAKDDWCDLYQYVRNNNMAIDANYDHVASQLDVMSLIDYFCINTFTVNSDWLNWNTAWWRGKSGNGVKWRYQLWDMDNIFNLGQNYSNIPSMDASQANACDIEKMNQFRDAGCEQGHVDIFNALMNNQKFRTLYINRYADLLNTTFSRANMLDHLNGMVADIQPEMQRHCARWEPNNPNSYKIWLDNVDMLRNQIKARAAKVYSSMDTCYSVRPVSGIVVHVTPAGAGKVSVNSITPAEFPVSLTYFSNTEVSFSAVAENKYRFSHWEMKGANTVRNGEMINISFAQADTLVAVFIERKEDSVENRNTVVMKDPASFAAEGNARNMVPLEAVATDHDFDEPLVVEFTNDAITEDTDNDNTGYVNAPGKIGLEKIAVPNAFTPNGDGNNDVLTVLGASMSNFEFVIYNMNGSVVFRSHNQYEGWDGTFKGVPCAAGTYIYFVSGELGNGSRVFTNSTVTLLR